MFKIEKIKNFDNWFLLPIIVLCILGGITVYSSTFFIDNAPSQLFSNQLLFYFVGIFLFFAISIFDISKLNNKFVMFGIFLLSNFLLLLVLVLGGVKFGAQRWIEIGAFTLQPSEFAKIFVILIASYSFTFSQRGNIEKILNVYSEGSKDTIESIRKFLRSEAFIKFMFGAVFVVLTILLIIKQKSLGNSILVCLIYAAIAISITKLSAKHLFLIIPVIASILVSFNPLNFENLLDNLHLGLQVFNIYILIVVFAALMLILASRVLKLNTTLFLIIFLIFLPLRPIFDYSYNNILEPYQRGRIETFFNPSKENSQDEDYNRQKSLEAIGSGQFFGKGFLKGNVVNSGLLPFAFTDFAFAAWAEQFGFAGSFIMIALFYFLIMKILSISSGTNY